MQGKEKNTALFNLPHLFRPHTGLYSDYDPRPDPTPPLPAPFHPPTIHPDTNRSHNSTLCLTFPQFCQLLQPLPIPRQCHCDKCKLTA